MNQGMFQPWCFTMVENDPSMVADLYDFWAKQPAQKFKTATCEGMANKGVSVHGRMYVVDVMLLVAARTDRESQSGTHLRTRRSVSVMTTTMVVCRGINIPPHLMLHRLGRR